MDSAVMNAAQQALHIKNQRTSLTPPVKPDPEDTTKQVAVINISRHTCDLSTYDISATIEDLPQGDSVFVSTFNYGDGTVANGDGMHTYTSKGTFTISYTALTLSGSSYTANRSIVVDSLPPTISLFKLTGRQDTIFIQSNNYETSFFDTNKLQWRYQMNNIPDYHSWYYIPATAGNYDVSIQTKNGCTTSASIDYTPRVKVGGVTRIEAPEENAEWIAIRPDFGGFIFNADNEFTFQITRIQSGGASPGTSEIIDLDTVKGNFGGLFGITIPPSLPCASNYSVRVVSSSPADTTEWSVLFAIKNQPAQPVIQQVGDSLFTSSIYALQWYKDDVAISGATGNVIRVSANGAYKVAASNGEGCTNMSDARAVVITDTTKAGQLKASFTAVPSKCDSSAFHFYGTYENLTPGDSVVSFFYQFDATSGGTTQNSFNQFLRGKGTYPVTFSIRTLQGDTASQTQYLFVPEVDRTAWPVEIKVDWDSSFPCNDYKILTASTTAPKAYYLMWSTGTSGNSIEVQQSGTYNVAVYDSCSVIRGVAQVEINVLEPFNPSITYIPGNPDTLMAPVPPANISYSWMKDNIELKDTGNYILPVGSGTYRVYAMNEKGCYPNNASFQYIDSIHHAASLTYEMSPCDSATFYISGNVENLSAGETIVSKTFDFGDGTTATEDGWHTFTTKGNFEMTFTAVTSSGNSYTTVKAYYNYRLPVSVSLSLHRGMQDTIFATPDYRDASFFTLEWSKDSVIMPDKGWFIIPSGAGKYEVYVKPRYGCTYSKYLDYTPAPAPAEAEAEAEVTAPAANASQLELSADFGNTTFNADNEFTIQLQVKDPNGRTIYATEAVNLGTIKGTDPANLSVAIPATLACASNYTVRVISSSPADTTKWSNTFAITNQPAQPVITQVGDSLFTSSIYDLQWYKDDVAIAGATNTAIRARANGAYKVAALNGEGCSSISAARAVVITAVSNVSFGSNTVSAFPNPSAGPVYLKFGYPLTQQVAVKVYNAQGNVVYTINTIRQQQLLELSALPKGFYIVEVAGYGTRKVLTIILQ